MKRDHLLDDEQDNGGNNPNVSNNNNGPSGPKRFRQSDEMLRVLIPSRVSSLKSTTENKRKMKIPSELWLINRERFLSV